MDCNLLSAESSDWSAREKSVASPGSTRSFGGSGDYWVSHSRGYVDPRCLVYDRGRAFTIGLILFGVSTMARAAESLVEASYNALVVISAKGLNPRLQVVACASSRETDHAPP